MAIHKLLQNNGELAWNEDFNDIQDLISRDLNQVLEGQYNKTTGVTAGSTVPYPKCVIGGFDFSVTPGVGALQVNIGKGLALVDRAETDVWSGSTPLAGQAKNNSYQIASNPETYSFNLNATIGARIDLIGAKFYRNTASEVRPTQVVIDNRRVVQQTSVPKHVEYVLDTITVAEGNPTLQDMDTDVTWGVGENHLCFLPLYAIYLFPSTSQFTSPANYLLYDLRLFYNQKFTAPDFTGVVQSPVVKVLNNTIRMANNAIADNGFIFPLAGPSKVEDAATSLPYTILSSSLTGGLAEAVDTFYYTYAFRPSPRSGYVGSLATNIAPYYYSAPTGIYKFCNPSAPVALPAPFTASANVQRTAYYLCSYKVFQNISTYNVRPFQKNDNYVELTGNRQQVSGGTIANVGTGATDSNIICSMNVNVQALYSFYAKNGPAYDGGSVAQGSINVIPPHATGVKLFIRATIPAGSTTFQFITDAGQASSNYYFDAGVYSYVTAGSDTVKFTVDYPFFNGTLIHLFLSTADFVFTEVRVLGYYE